MNERLLALAAIFSKLSLLAVGGGNTVIPDMQREVVEVHGWMSATDFTTLFALAQAAPGPNLMICTLIGLNVAGLPGAMVATLGIVGPSSALTIATVSVWHRFRNAAWRRIIQAGIVPVTVGMWSAGGAVVAYGADGTLMLAAITGVVAAILLTTRVHPLWLLGAGALLGILGVV